MMAYDPDIMIVTELHFLLHSKLLVVIRGVLSTANLPFCRAYDKRPSLPLSNANMTIVALFVFPVVRFCCAA